MLGRSGLATCCCRQDGGGGALLAVRDGVVAMVAAARRVLAVRLKAMLSFLEVLSAAGVWLPWLL